jgi:hypothetical protein
MPELSPFPLIQFPRSAVEAFRNPDPQNLRWGQAFYDHMQLHKCVQDRAFCDLLYNERDEAKAKAMVAALTDYNS